MSVILYARVSTTRQADRELSNPAQLRLCREHAVDRGLLVAGEFSDVASGTSLKGRSGLVAALRLAKRDTTIDGLVVHKVDRLARSMFTHLTLKADLRRAGVRIHSVIEPLEPSPMGEFIEHVMAAQAEFYSANLGAEVKRGLEERLRRGQWASAAPVGYLIERGQLVFDPARAHFMRDAFNLWATGEYTAARLADEIHRRGLVGPHGKKIKSAMFCRLLKNPLYCGRMVVKGQQYLGIHQPIVPSATFDRCQEVFRLKVGSRRPRRHLRFLLQGKLRCAWCGSNLVGEFHQKPSGKTYRYYRCHQACCRFSVRAHQVEDAVCRRLRDLQLPARLLPWLRRNLVAAKRHRSQELIERVRHLRGERRRLEEVLKTSATSFITGRVAEDVFWHDRQATKQAIRVTEWLLANPEAEEVDQRGAVALLRQLEALDATLDKGDVVAKSGALGSLIERIELTGPTPALTFTSDLQQLVLDRTASVHVTDGPLPLLTISAN